MALRNEILIFFIFALISALGGALAADPPNGPDPFNTRFVDHISGPTFNNFLFRGPTPWWNRTFQFNWLMNNLRNAAKQSSIQLPEQFYLVDFSLLNLFQDFDILEGERQYFAANPKVGKLLNFPILGAFTNPMSYPDGVRKIMAQYAPSLADIPNGLDGLNEVMHTKMNNSTPILVYMHCRTGKDRTGALAGAYALTNWGWSFEQTLYYQDECFGGSKKPHPLNGRTLYDLDWFCWELVYSNIHPELNCTPNFDYKGFCQWPQ